MPRLQTIPDDQMTARQREVVAEAAAGRRGRVPAPMLAWLASPELARRAQRLGEFLRYETSLPPRLSELAILVTARHWTAQYEWYAHKKEALKAGLPATTIDAIACRRRPALEGPDAAVYDLARELHETRGISDAVWTAATAALGAAGVAELVGLLGYYTLVAMTINTYQLPLPPGETPELD